MARVSPAARAAAAWRSGGKKPAPPRHMSTAAKRIWWAIVNDRPPDWFRPGSLELLEQLCEVVIAQRAALAQLAAAPTDPEAVKVVKDLAGIVNSTAVKLRLSVQADVDRHSGKKDEKEPGADVLLGGWKRSA